MQFRAFARYSLHLRYILIMANGRKRRAGPRRRRPGNRRTTRRTRVGTDPGPITIVPWNRVTLEFNDDLTDASETAPFSVSVSLNDSVVRTAIFNQLGLNGLSGDTTIAVRLLALTVWGEAYGISPTATGYVHWDGITVRLEGNIFPAIQEVLGSEQTSQGPLALRTKSDSPTPVKPAMVSFRWPRSHSTVPIRLNGTADLNIANWSITESGTTAPFTSTNLEFHMRYKARLHVLWRTEGGAQVERAADVSAHPARSSYGPF